jgi:hypothetical protein
VVAAAAGPAPGHGHARGGRSQVGYKLLLLVQHLRSDRNAQLDGLARGAVAAGSATGPALAGLEVLPRPERREVP